MKPFLLFCLGCFIPGAEALGKFRNTIGFEESLIIVDWNIILGFDEKSDYPKELLSLSISGLRKLIRFIRRVCES